MYEREHRDIIGGCLIMACGVFTALYAQNYSVGDISRMGPGYFPAALGVILTVLGILITVIALFRKGAKITIHWRGAFWIILSLIVFSFTLERIGLVLSTVACTMISTVATSLSIKTRIYVSLTITAITFFIFYIGLRMSLTIWPI